jgi:hypothetical protein
MRPDEANTLPYLWKCGNAHAWSSSFAFLESLRAYALKVFSLESTVPIVSCHLLPLVHFPRLYFDCFFFGWSHHRILQRRQQHFVPAMPYSDNLYSAPTDNSDAESFSDELSPTDGYFRREVPSGAMVPDPSQASRDNKSVEDKVLIPTYRPGASTNSGEASGTTNSPTLAQLHPHTSHHYASPTTNTASNPAPIRSPPSSSASNTPSSPRSSRRTDPLHPSLAPVMGVPPPAYSPSPISPQAPQGRSYNTFDRQQPQQEHQQQQGEHLEDHRLSRDPESMGRPYGAGSSNEDPHESTPLYARVERNPRRRVIFQKILFVALVFAVMAACL